MQQLRTTTGQRVTISYDPRSNTMTFREADWFAEPLRATGVPVKSETSVQNPKFASLPRTLRTNFGFERTPAKYMFLAWFRI